MTTVGLILAAGNSRRFGASDKLMADFDGRPLAAHAALAMRQVPLDHRLVIIRNPLLEPIFEGFEILHLNEAPGGGQADSLKQGVERAQELGGSRLLVALADMPMVSAGLMRKVLGRCCSAFPAAASDGARRMPPACFPESAFSGLMALKGDRGAGRFIEALPCEQLVLCDPVELRDIDTRADLAAIGSKV